MKRAGKFKAALAAMLSVALTLPLCGCMPYRELKSESIVEGMGIDYGPEGYILTLQIYNPKQSGGGGGQKGGSSNTVTLMQCSGSSIFDAVRNATLQNGRKLYFSNVRAFVVGQGVFGDNFARLLDFFERNQQIRPTGRMFAAMGKASDIMSFKKDDEIVPAVNIELMAQSNTETSKIRDIKLIDVFETSATGIVDPTLTALGITKGSGGEPQLQMAGTAVFQKNRLAGYLDLHQTRGLMWVKGEAKGGTILLNLKDQGMATMEVIGSKSRVNVSGDEKHPVIKVNIEVSSNITEIQSAKEITINDAFLRSLKKIQNETVKNEAEAAINQSLRVYGTDVFGFGLEVFESKPELWRKVGKNWNQSLKTLRVEVKVDTKIRHIGTTKKSTG